MDRCAHYEETEEAPSALRVAVACLAAAGASVIAVPIALLFVSGTSAVQLMPVFVIFGLPIALLHLFLLALPAYAVLTQFWRLRWWNSALAGFVIGAAPYGLLTFGIDYESDELRETMLVEGGYTAVGWLLYLKNVAAVGALGLVGGLAFWAVLRPSKKGGPSPDRPF